MSRLKLAGPALLYVVFLFPTFAQDPTANMFAKQVEHDVAALSSQPSVGAWQKLHPGEKLQLMHYDLGKADYADDLGLEFDNWCAGSISQSPSTFGRVAVFFVPSVKVGALPPLPGSGYASIKESCRMQALHYRVSPDTSAQDLVRELSSVWGTSDRGHAISGSQFDLPEGVCDIIANWDHDGLSARLKYSCSGGPVSTYRTGIMLYVRRDAIPAAPCDDCEGSLIFPLYSEKLPQYLQEAAQIAAEDPALTQQIISWSGHWNNPRWDPKWAVEPAVARNNLRKWLEVAKQRSPHQRAAALLLADLYVEGADLVYAAKPDAPPPAEFFRGLGAEYDQQGNYLHNFLEQAEKMDDGEEVSELASLWIASQNCPWPDGAIEHGESLLARFPSDPWTPYVHYALAMAHDAKVLWTYPGSDFEDPDDKKPFSPLPPLTKDHERDAAIEHFKAFLDARPGGRVAAFTWTEAWRLLAGLPPYGPHWGCTGE